MIARRESRPPRMREAYPQLDIRRAMSAHARGKSLCLIYDEESRAHGLIEFGAAADGSQAWLDGWIATRNSRPWNGPSSIVLVPNPNGVLPDRRAMSCPECERRCEKLTWIGSWRCRACDGLLDRRQLISPDTRRAEKLLALRARLSVGRRKGQHQATFDRLTASAEELSRELKGRGPRMPAPEHRRILHSEWLSIAEYRQQPSLHHLSIPSEDRERRGHGWLEELEIPRDAVPQTQPAAAQSATPEVSRMSFDVSLRRAGDGKDPDEVSVDDM